MPSKPKEEPITLDEFMRRRRRAGCKVCAIPEPARQLLYAARDKKYKVEDKVAWLKEAYNIVLTRTEYENHTKGNHDAA